MRPVRSLSRPWAALLLLACCLHVAASTLHAEEAPSTPAVDPAAAAAAYAAAVKRLPAPSAEAGFAFTGVLHINGKNLGFARLTAAPATGDTPRWEAHDHFVLKGRATPSVQRSHAILDPTLTLISGESSATGEPDLRWTRTAEGFDVRSGGTDAQQKLMPHQGTALNTMASTVLLCRLLLAAKATYATTIFEPEDGVKGKPAMQPVVVEILGETDLQGRTVLAAQAVKEDKTLTMLFQPETKALVALRLEQGTSKVEILPGDLWVMPAGDAVTAGMRAMYGLAAKQLRVLDDVVAWPTAHAAAVARMSEAQREKHGDVEAWRKAMLTLWSEKLTERPAPMMQQFIASQKAQIKQEALEGGRVKLTFPPMLRGMVMVVGEQAGAWHLVDLPAQPKPADAKGSK